MKLVSRYSSINFRIFLLSEKEEEKQQKRQICMLVQSPLVTLTLLLELRTLKFSSSFPRKYTIHSDSFVDLTSHSYSRGGSIVFKT